MNTVNLTGHIFTYLLSSGSHDAGLVTGTWYINRKRLLYPEHIHIGYIISYTVIEHETCKRDIKHKRLLPQFGEALRDFNDECTVDRGTLFCVEKTCRR